MDKLQSIIDHQEALQSRLGYDFKKMFPYNRVNYIKEYSIHATQELHEMLYELPYFKPWKDYNELSPKDVENKILKAREEYIDFLHFVFNIGLALGFDNAEDLWKEYLSKNIENHRRQDLGYKETK